MSAQLQVNNEILQGSDEWLALRKTKITATDAVIIMSASPWKSKIELYHEKMSDENNTYVNPAMKRGLDLEPIGRDLFWLQTGIEVNPCVVIKDWAMASLDGISLCGKYIVEIKCPGEKIHAIALSGKVPEHYYPQLQHQIFVCDVEFAYYFSFDGADGVYIKVPRDNDYIEKMLVEEEKFYQCLINKTPPEGDYTERNDALWSQCATQWKCLTLQIKELEKQEEELRRQLIFLSGESNSKGAGISLCQIQKKGNVDYSKIECLKDIDLDKYRKSSSSYWKITGA
jgi:putative phage-type endonuclease